MKSLSVIIIVMMFVSASGLAQALAENVIGNHGGVISWERSPASMDIKPDHQYVLTTFNWKLEQQTVVTGTWRVEGETVVLVDRSDKKTILHYYKGTWYMVNENGYSCVARFFQDKDVKELWAGFKASGC